jgi:hypothetical protein
MHRCRQGGTAWHRSARPQIAGALRFASNDIALCSVLLAGDPKSTANSASDVWHASCLSRR